MLAAFYYSDTVRQKAYELLEDERDSVEKKVQAATQMLQAQQESIRSINTDLAQQNIDLQQAILADAQHIREIVRHLVSNAIKFTESGSVSLRCELYKGVAESRVRVLVQDTGIGIAPEFQESLFLPFQQNNSSKNRSFGGLGLGLAITKRLTYAMNGKIWCDSDKGKGTTFTVELPCSLA